MSLAPAGRTSHSGWLESIPAGWGEVHLRWLARLYSGGTPDKSKDEFWADGTIPWINSGAVNQGLVTEPSALISQAGYEGSSARWVPEGALVMALAGQGKTKGMVAQMGLAATCNQSMAAIVPYGVEARYLFYWLSANYKRIRSGASDDLRDGLNLQMLGDIPCPVPNSRAAQSSIANFLDEKTARIDALIAEKEELRALLVEAQNSAVSEAVTRGVDPTAVLQDTGREWLGGVPHHWKVKPLKYLLMRPSGLVRGPFGGDLKKDTFVSRGYKVYEQKNAIYGDVSLGNAFISPEKYEEMGRFHVHAGDFLMSCSGTVGRVFRVPADAPPGIINQALLILRFTNELRPQFAELLFKADFFKTQILDNSQGGAMKNLVGMDVFTSIVLPVPPLEEQDEIIRHMGHTLTRYDSLQSHVEEHIARLREYRSSLISAAVTGQLDISTFKAA